MKDTVYDTVRSFFIDPFIVSVSKLQYRHIVHICNRHEYIWANCIPKTTTVSLCLFWLNNTLINFVLSQCSQRLYLLKLLRSQGFSPAQLDQVSQALIVSRLRYALPVWSGFLSADLINRIQALLKRLFKFGYSLRLVSFRDLMQSCSEDLFDNAHKSNHCLHGLLSSYVHRLESLRPRGHDLMLPACTGYLHKQSFITRSLFEFI